MKVPGEADITCPKCHDAMIISKIEGIEVEKCIGCRGFFLTEARSTRSENAYVSTALAVGFF